ncbi:MAG: hypothetical protein DCC58_02845 [Chloroflexi bacterium]|nr:MAG: hypothetical protein DCC58_02845 [Chloroflexota bacterium]
MTTADIVIVGGGVTGTSTAFHLASLGARNVLLLERGQLAGGASGKSAAQVRMHYTNVHEAKLAFESLKIFQNWGEIVGGDCGFRPVGYVQIAPTGMADRMAIHVQQQQLIGIDTRLVGPDELRELQPEMRVDDVPAAAWEASSGYADPLATTWGFAAAAQRLGVRVRLNTEVLRVLVERERVVGVETAAGVITCQSVVLCPGAYANRLIGPLGLDYGLQTHRVQAVVFRWPPGFAGHAVCIDPANYIWFRPSGDGGTICGLETTFTTTPPEEHREGVDQGFVERARRQLAARLPTMDSAVMRGGWAGLCMMSPDERAIIDQPPSVAGLYLMLGDSDSSFKTAPAIGKCLAEWILEGAARTVDLYPWRSTRFAEGKPWHDELNYAEARIAGVG